MKIAINITDDMQMLRQVFEAQGFEIRFVGGAVRDIIRGVAPKDIDFATTATPDQMLALAKANDIRVIETGLQHGTVTFVVNGEGFEITTLRVDEETDGRHAVVAFTTDWQKDAERRDLTINAMSIDFDGNLFDYFDGYNDLITQHIRFVGDARARIQEDYLRILRFFRFIGKFDNAQYTMQSIDPINDEIAKMPVMVSGERIWMEIRNIFASPNYEKIIRAMTFDKSIINLNDTFVPTTSDDPVIRFAVNCRSVEALADWKMDNETVKRITWIKQTDLVPEKVALRRIVVDGEPMGKWMDVFEANGLTHNFNIQPIFPLTGNDFIQAGMKPGPELGKIIKLTKGVWFDALMGE